MPMETREFENNSSIKTIDGFSVCFWMKPSRFQETNDIVYFSTEYENKFVFLKLFRKYIYFYRLNYW